MLNMQILVVSDIHGKESGLTTIIENIRRYQPDMVAICGDITNFGSPHNWVERVINSIPIKTLVVPGNCDPRSLPDDVAKTGAINLHNRKFKYEGCTFVGFGGSQPTLFGPMFITPEDEIYSSLDALMEPRAILVVHVPPLGHLDKVGGVHAGSEGMRRILEKWHPRLVLSGHVHECRGIETNPETVFVNPGPAHRGYAAIVNVDDKITARLIT